MLTPQCIYIRKITEPIPRNCNQAKKNDNNITSLILSKSLIWKRTACTLRPDSHEAPDQFVSMSQESFPRFQLSESSQRKSFQGLQDIREYKIPIQILIIWTWNLQNIIYNLSLNSLNLKNYHIHSSLFRILIKT